MRISDWSSDVCSSDLRRGYCRDGSHRHSYIEASCGVVYPEAVAIAHYRSKGGPSMGRMTKPGAAAKRSGKMQIAWPSGGKVVHRKECAPATSLTPQKRRTCWSRGASRNRFHSHHA